ncbi:GNAT family N-acetyltransferase [Microscilla marina]|uniref:GCN5-related N-acetyltransferase n=1 Tax=Microscilla marina ATCC 23134 TaxID=313606 RepID=A1ZTQ5_MICM2|nr:GNAT family N-acetyltransferase [Microscilla marina]EAY26315.1 GCN5-related N-acetyltransferase [Microscilla marina ATCC 23134]
MTVQIIKANIDDIPKLNKISIASKKHWGYPDAWIAQWHEALTISPNDLVESIIFKAVLDSEIIGFCALCETPENYEVLHLWLDPAYIGKGYGKTLLTEALARVAVQPKDIIVEADPYAEPFYAKMGFVTIGQVAGTYPPGRVLPLMRRER